MSEPDTTAALTETEWTQWEATKDAGIVFELKDGPLCLGGYGVPYELSANQRHRLAALALVGQPFGFLHSDVATCLGVIDQMAMPDAGTEAQLRSLASRIASLLPPAPRPTEAP